MMILVAQSVARRIPPKSHQKDSSEHSFWFYFTLSSLLRWAHFSCCNLIPCKKKYAIILAKSCLFLFDLSSLWRVVARSHIGNAKVRSTCVQSINVPHGEHQEQKIIKNDNIYQAMVLIFKLGRWFGQQPRSQKFSIVLSVAEDYSLYLIVWFPGCHHHHRWDNLMSL